MNLLEFAPLLLMAGALAGVLAGLFGIGGGIVVVPAVFSLLVAKAVPQDIAMALAIATSLASIVPTAVSSTLAHNRLGHVHWPLVVRCFPALVVGVALGIWLLKNCPKHYFIVYFSVFLVCLAVYQGCKPARIPVFQAALNPLWHYLMALLLGASSVVAGVGGGALGVPLLQTTGLSSHQAVGTCAALGFLIALPSALYFALGMASPSQAPFGTTGLVFWPALVCLAPLTTLFAPLGARLGKRLSAEGLNRCFAVFLVLVAGRMLWAAWGG